MGGYGRKRTNMEYKWKQINLTVVQVSITHTMKVRRGGSQEELA